MTEPTSTAVAAAAGAATALVFGAQPDAVVLGLLGATLSTSMMDSMGKLRQAFAAALFGSLAAGYLSPLAAVGVGSWLPAAMQAGIKPDALRMPAALVIGAVTPTVWPIVLRVIGRRIDAEGGQ